MANKSKYVTANPVEKPTGTHPTLPKTVAPVKTVPTPKKGVAELPVEKPGGNAVAMGAAQSPAAQTLPKTTAPVETVPSHQKGTAELPVENPVGSAQTMGSAQPETNQLISVSHSAPDAQDGTVDYEKLIEQALKQSAYTSLNSQINGNPEAHYEEVDRLKEELEQNPSDSDYMSQGELLELAEKYGIDSSMFDSFSQKGGYTQNINEALAGGGSGEPVEGFYLPGTWYWFPGSSKPVQEGTSGADEQYLSDGAYALVQALKSDWAELDKLAQEAYARGDMESYNDYIAQRNECNVLANRIRNLSGYSGGSDGSMYIPNGQLGIDDRKYPFRGGNGTPSSLGSLGSLGGTGSGTGSGTGDKYGDSYIDSLIEDLIGGTGGGTTDAPTGGTYGEDYIKDLIGTVGGSENGELNKIDPYDGLLATLLEKYSQGNAGGVNADLSDLAAGASQDPLSHISTEKLAGILEQWRDTAQKQSEGQIDYATQQAITELERALQDAQPQFKEQAESISLDEQRAMDNAALYAALQGDRGGIGQAQYTSVQNAAAQNRLAVQQAQTKLSTDMARQIADLRAQGDFEKADKALEITQNYLSQLFGLEQWAMENNLNVGQFNAQLKQWESEYQMALKQLGISVDQWNQEFGFSKDQFMASLGQWGKEFQFNQEQAAIDNAQWEREFESELQRWAREFAFNQERADVSDSQWQKEFETAVQQWAQEFAFNKERADVSDSQWQKEFDAAMTQWQKEYDAAYKSGSGTSSSSSVSDTSNNSNIYEALQSAGATDYGTAYAMLRNAGYNTTDAHRYAEYYAGTWAKDPAKTIGSSAKYEYAISMAQGMTEEEADVFLGALVADGSITQAEAEYIYDNVLTFLTIKDKNDKYQPVTWN